MTPQAEANIRLWRDICTPGQHPEWFYWFMRIAWGIEYRRTELGKFFDPAIHRPYCAWLQSHADAWRAQRQRGELGRVHVMSILPRGTAKTLFATKGMTLALQVDDPNLSAYIGSEVHKKAQEFLLPIKQVLDGTDNKARFAELFGNWSSATDASRPWTQTEIVHAARTSTAISEPSIGTFGVDMGFAGKHPNLVTFDDLVSLETYSDLTVEAATKSYEAIYPALQMDAFVQFVGTRYGQDDPIQYVLRRDGIASWSGRDAPRKEFAPNGGRWHVYFLQGEDGNGVPLMPTIWPPAEMAHYKRTKPGEFAAQVQNDPTTGGHQPLDRAYVDTLVMKRTTIMGDDATDISPFRHATIHCDTAFKDPTARGTDYTALVTWFHDLRANGMVYLHRVQTDKVDSYGREVSSGGTWGWPEFAQQLVEILAECRRLGIRVSAITDEKSTGGRGDAIYETQIRDYLREAGLKCPRLVFLVRQESSMGHLPGASNKLSAGKHRRINRAATQWLEGYVRLFADAKNRGILENEMLRIGQIRHEDVSDAAADVFTKECWQPPALDERSVDGLLAAPGDDILKQLHWTVGDFLRASPTRNLRDPQRERTIWARPRRGVGWEDG